MDDDRTPVARRLTLLATGAAVVVLLGLTGWAWWTSLVPSSYSVADMGYVDDGRGDSGSGPRAGSSTGHGGHAGSDGSVSVADLTGPAQGTADVVVRLTAAQERFRLASGRETDGYTLNGTSPGPMIEAVEGDLVEVRLHNASVAGGVTLHWHGVDVPNAEDGVAGVTQDAVGVGEDHVYRFVVPDAGTYWYHSHQVSHEQVVGGLLGAFVVHPSATTGADPARADTDVTVVVHTYRGVLTLDGEEHVRRVDAPSGSTARVRMINTDSGAASVWASGTWRVLAVDGRDVHGPGPVGDAAVLLPAGGRADLEVQVPDDGGPARVQVGTGSVALVGPAGTAPGGDPPSRPERTLDLLTYGTPAPLGLDPGTADRSFEYTIDRGPGFLDGRPGMWWTVNGRTYPDLPMFMVSEGDVVRVRYTNNSDEAHPMHLHGHHAVVLARDGVEASGSPWWFDSLEVDAGETYDVAFVADNPGIWMDHCHNLQHAADGLVTHLMYAGVSAPYRVGGDAGNAPE